MLNRKETEPKKKKTALMKLLIASISTVFILGGTLTISFANEDLDAMLTNWFDEKRMDAIVNIKNAVSSEKDVQKERLREELKKEMAVAEAELNKITEAEKALRIKNLRDYTDKLINGITIDNSAEKEQIKNQLNSIYDEAVNALNTADSSWKSSVKPAEPAKTSQPQDAGGQVKPAEPKAEEPADPPEVPAEPPVEDPVPPAESPATAEEVMSGENNEGDASE